MKTRQLGTNGPAVSAIGLGCMSFAGFFGETDTATSHKCLDAATDHGITFLDTANVYGAGRSETVIGDWLRKAPRDVAIATKGAITRDKDKPVDNSENHLRHELEQSLKRLGRDHVALYYAHRRDPAVPVEDLAGVMGQFIDEGKIGGYGLSEVAPATLRRAHAERPCTAVQSEYSLWTRTPEMGMLQATQALGVAFVPFSPLARGVLSDSPPVPADMAENDYRREIPRFSTDNFPRNQAIIGGFRAYAAEKGWTTSAMALAWALSRGEHLIPIPGTRTGGHLADWIKAANQELTADELNEIGGLLPPGFAHGDRYSLAQMGATERYC